MVVDPTDEHDARLEAFDGEASSIGSAIRDLATRHERWAAGLSEQMQTLLQGLTAAEQQRDQAQAERDELERLTHELRREQDALWDELRSIQADAADVVAHRDRLAEANQVLEEELDLAQQRAASSELALIETRDREQATMEAHEATRIELDSALGREMALSDANASLERELDALSTEKEDAVVLRHQLETELEQARREVENLRAELANRDTEFTVMRCDLEAAERARAALTEAVDGLRTELKALRAKSSPGISRTLAASTPTSDDTKSDRGGDERRGGVVEVVRHRSDVGNRL